MTQDEQQQVNAPQQVPVSEFLLAIGELTMQARLMGKRIAELENQLTMTKAALDAKEKAA